MEPEGSLPHSQVPATCPYPEPDRSSPCLPPQSHLLTIHFNIILPSTPESSKWSLSLTFPHQNPVYTYPLPHTCYMSRPSHSSRFDHPKNIWWGAPHYVILTVIRENIFCPPYDLLARVLQCVCVHDFWKRIYSTGPTFNMNNCHICGFLFSLQLCFWDTQRDELTDRLTVWIKHTQIMRINGFYYKTYTQACPPPPMPPTFAILQVPKNGSVTQY